MVQLKVYSTFGLINYKEQVLIINKQRFDYFVDLLNMGRIQELRERMGSETVKMNEKALWKCLGAEFLGTALLMFLGIGCVLKLEHEEVKGLSFVGVALCWGLTVATLVQVRYPFFLIL